jgi:tetratricopeptide (TPR) repeat protein
MIARRQKPVLKLGVPVLVFAVLLGAFTLANRSGGTTSVASGEAQPTTGLGRPARNTEELIAGLQRQVRAQPGEATGYAQLGDAYLQRTRETGDFGFYVRAERSFDEALRREPGNATATVGAGTLALARHDFDQGLRLGRRALALAPETVRPYAVIVDGQVELGRYSAARRSLQRMVDLKPNLASYSRVSYYRELHGDVRGAIEAMRLAVSAGGGTPESVAFVQTLLGDLLLDARDVAGARRAYRQALAGAPDHLPAEAGLARVDVATGRLPAAARRLRAVSRRLPLPTYLTPLAEIELALGRRTQASRDLELVRAQRRLLEAAGTRTDVDLVLSEADHGSPRRAVRLGRQVLAAAPSVRSDDALGWALTRAGQPEEGLLHARRAIRLGSVDPSFHYHAGIAARGVGRPVLARRELREALRLNPSFSPFHAQRARRALRALT